MVAEAGEIKRSQNAGELSPDLAGAVDIKQYYAGGLRYKNIEPVVQAGFRQMAGSFDNGPVRARLDTIAQTGVTPDETAHTGTATVWSATIAGDVAAVHLDTIAAAGLAGHTAVVEVLVGATWTQIGPAVLIGTTAKTRTFARAPGSPLAVATSVRVRVTFTASDSVTISAVTVLKETTTFDHPRYEDLRHDSGDRYLLSATVGWLDIFLDDDFAAGVYLPAITAAILPEIGFYAENAVIGIFHRQMETLRVTRVGSASEWQPDLWPYSGVPTADLGGVYTKHDDVWEINVKWANGPVTVRMSIIVNGETTPSIVTTDSGGTTIAIQSCDIGKFADDVAAAINDLPSIAGDVTATGTIYDGGNSGSAGVTITFGGASSGDEYQVTAQITNTASASALPSHLEIGKTDFEPILSDDRGWTGGAELVQDRLGYLDLLSVPSAIPISQAGEYYTLNIEAAGDAAARLDKLRAGQTAERVLGLLDATYLLAFTDQGVHFASNRTITKSDPLNYTQASSVGIVANTRPLALQSKIYYVGHNDKKASGGADVDGHQILSLAYDDISTTYTAQPESLRASHLVRGIIRDDRQASETDQDADRIWALRSDGRVIAAHEIPSQDIELGFCEWVPAASGLARELKVDGNNDVRLAIERGGKLRHERLDRNIFLQAALTLDADMAGQVAGLDIHEGREVWAVASGYVEGPFTVSGGAIDLGVAYAGVTGVVAGLWQAPVFESMPRYHVLPNDTIIKRPGRIFAAQVEIIETASIAVGANGQPAVDVPLLETSDATDQPMPAKTKMITVAGLLGQVVGPTFVVTQARPGPLRVRDFTLQERL
jgi:hypothetical protein